MESRPTFYPYHDQPRLVAVVEAARKLHIRLPQGFDEHDTPHTFANLERIIATLQQQRAQAAQAGEAIHDRN